MTCSGRPFTILLIATVFSVSACVRVLTHDEQAAAKVATEFARFAFVEQDLAKSYALLSASAANRMNKSDFETGLMLLHSKNHPDRVEATAYQPLPGNRGMAIYIKGTHNEEKYYYEISMDGDKTEGYKVEGFYRGEGPFNPITQRPL